MANKLKMLMMVVLGLSTVLSFAPFYGALVPMATLAVWVVLIERASSVRQALWLGMAWGVGFFGLGVQWVYTTVYTIGGMPQLLGAVMYGLFALYLSLYPAFVAMAMKWIRQRSREYSLYAVWGLVFPVLWVISEWLRGEGSLGFNWLTLGYSQVGVTPLVGWARWVGVYGVSYWVVAFAGVLGVLCLQCGEESLGSKPRQWMFSSPLSLALLVLGGGVCALGEWALHHSWTQPGTSLHVSLIQGNVPQENKWDDQWQLGIFKRYTRLLNQAKGHLVVVPETALPVLRHQLPRVWVEELQSTFRKEGRTALLGLVERSDAMGHYYNSIWTYGQYSEQDYRKRHLVPFGEFVPGIQWLSFFERWWTMPLAAFGRGVVDPSPLKLGQGVVLAPSICYEDGFSSLFQGQAEQATVLLNVSNDAWFGDGIAIDQHLQIAQMRSIESAKPMIRANNTAGTAVIDASGRVVQQLPHFKEGILESEVLTQIGVTPFMHYGESLTLMLCAVSVLCAWGVSGMNRKAAS